MAFPLPLPMRRALDLAAAAAAEGEVPVGAVIARGEEIIATSANMMLAGNDPTAHAEIVAVRDACRRLGNYQLGGCDVYASCEPCPMCLGALYWARPRRVIYAATRDEAAGAGFDDAFIYREIGMTHGERKIPFYYAPVDGAVELFRLWREKGDRKIY